MIFMWQLVAILARDEEKDAAILFNLEVMFFFRFVFPVSWVRYLIFF